MPSGAKRRKAAKKKKEQDAPGGSEATSFNEGDDLKGQESDGGEVSSPASQDPLQSGGHSFIEEGGDRESSPEKGTVEEVVVAEEVRIVKVDVDEGRADITGELKSDEVLESRDLSVAVGKSSDGSSDGSSSSSSSDDDEEIHVEKTKVVLDSAKVEEASEVVEITEDSQMPAMGIEDVVYVTEASPLEEPYEDLDKPVLPESNSEMKATADDALLPTSEIHGESSNVDSSDAKDAEDKVLPPSGSPIAVTDNGVGHLKDPEIHDSFEKQTPVPQARIDAQRTSWKGCCGLFEVFTGSR